MTADIEGVENLILTGAKDGVTKFDLNTGEHEYIAKYWAGQPDAEARTEKYVDSSTIFFCVFPESLTSFFPRQAKIE